MNLIKRLIFFIKSFFSKKEIKMIESISEKSFKDEKKYFIELLKKDSIKNKEKKEKKEIKTLICEGDGLGIQGKITY